MLEQQTELQQTEIMSTTGAYTDTIFGIFHLRGFQFSPRLADIGGTRFWRVDGRADYGALNELATQRVNTAFIVQHSGNLLRLHGSLKLGTVQAAGLIRILQTKDRPTKLARALEELGWLIKTLYLLGFIDDAVYRRRILVQINRGEGRYQLARTVFDGKRGELRQRYQDGQEDQLGTLGRLSLNPTIDRRMVTKTQHSPIVCPMIAMTRPIAAIPSDRPAHDLTLKVTFLEVRHDAVAPLLKSHPDGQRQSLQQGPLVFLHWSLIKLMLRRLWDAKV